jgi:hypothetical protein
MAIEPPLFEPMKRMRAAWPSRGWSWDGRLNCMTSTIAAEFETQARKAIGEVFPQTFTTQTLIGAPPRVREFVERTGGLRAGQYAFAGGNPAGLLAFGLWWPWGDAMTISVRVGLCDLEASDEPYPRLLELFGVSIY